MNQRPERYKLALLALVFLVLPLVSMYFHGKTERTQTFIESGLLGVTAPGQTVMHGAFSTLVNAWDKYVFLVSVEEQNQELRTQLQTLAQKVGRTVDLEEENRRLRSALDFKRERSDLKLVSAQVVGRDISPQFSVVRIHLDRGQEDGLKPQMPVVTSQGVVGRIETLSGPSADVLLVTDSRSRIDVNVSGKSVNGIVQGTGDGLPVFRFPYQKARLAKGDVLVTTGHDKVYPKGLVVGYLTQADPKQVDQQLEISVEPAVLFSTLQEMFVITNLADQSIDLPADREVKDE